MMYKEQVVVCSMYKPLNAKQAPCRIFEC